MSEKIFELWTDKEDLAAFREKLKELLRQTGMDEKKNHEVVLAVDEALANISRHGYGGHKGKIEIVFRENEQSVEILIRDYGKYFDLTKAPLPELPPTKPGGLGIYFIHTAMDEVGYHTAASGANELRLTKSKK